MPPTRKKTEDRRMAILRFSGRMLFILLAGIHIDQLDEVLVALLRSLLVAREEGIGALALPAPRHGRHRADWRCLVRVVFARMHIKLTIF